MLSRGEHGHRDNRPTLPRIGDILGDELFRSPRDSHTLSPPTSRLPLLSLESTEFERQRHQYSTTSSVRDVEMSIRGAQRTDLRGESTTPELPMSKLSSHPYLADDGYRSRRRFSDVSENSALPYRSEPTRNKSHSLSDSSDLMLVRHEREHLAHSPGNVMMHPHTPRRDSRRDARDSTQASHFNSSPLPSHSPENAIRLPPIYDHYKHTQNNGPPPLKAAISLPGTHDADSLHGYGRSESDMRSYRFLNHQGSETASQKSSLPPRYECPYCSKRFSRPSSLKTHTHHHTGEKPFVCPYPECGRGFSVYSNMRRHTRLHTQDSQKLNETSGEEGGEGSTVSNSPPMSSSGWLPQISSNVYRESNDRHSNTTPSQNPTRSPHSLRPLVPTVSGDSSNIVAASDRHSALHGRERSLSVADVHSESRWQGSISRQTAASQSFFSK